ncbi:hypothetical protein [Agromyces ramosus]|uniref:DUF4352 domain-containing protein n=1 Tax=Agromyces ramosus TaxID=33879 RepID=A0ABU0R892_9MICO|nr:hypothetical protein [Agromyces ramosus]MDQ0894305.1 hypothetical protein [Agromyces ramosus]
MTRWLPALAGAALVVAAWGVAAVTPGDEAAEQPFAVAATVGERAAGRNLAATITGLRGAEAVTNDGWRAEGSWLLVDLEAEAVLSERGTLLSLATLDVGGRSYRASERPPASLFRSSLAIGLPHSGTLAFELPAGAFTASEGDDAVLRLGLHEDPRLDSVIELRLDLAEVEVDDEAELAPVVWVGR